jgi:hypothetical protein
MPSLEKRASHRVLSTLTEKNSNKTIKELIVTIYYLNYVYILEHS